MNALALTYYPIKTLFAARFTFSAKEKDTETGYSYFGSRYYNSDLSIWLSVDPMSDKYPSLSPYTYCANNPIKLVDPNGEEIVDDKPPGKLSNLLNNLDHKVVGSSDNRKFEGHSDGANRGTVTKQDVEVATAVITTIVSAGSTLEAEGALETTVAVMSTINSVDDATANSSGQTASQRVSSNNQTANKTVNAVKTATSVASAGYSGYKVLKTAKDAFNNGRQVLKDNAVVVMTEATNFASNTYNSIKSFFKKRK